MDKLATLLEKATETHAAELKILHNARVSTLKAYNAEPTAANKKNLDAASQGLEETIARLWAEYVPEDSRFKTLLDVVGYLQGQGYKIQKSKIYQDRKNKQIRVQSDGSVLKKDADAYAKTLPRLGDPLRGLEASQARKAELEVSRLEQQIAGLEHELNVKRDKYVLREDAERERAGNATAIFVGIANGIIGSARVLIDACQGNPKMLNEFVEAIKQLLNQAANALATMETIDFTLEQ